MFATAGTALAQGAPSASSSQPKGWKVSGYPVLAWLPVTIGIEVNVPRDINGGGGSGGGSERAKILDSQFDGAFLGGFSATNGTVRIDAEGLWAAVGGDQADSPNLTVDVDVIYGRGAFGVRLYKDLFAHGGVRRFALKYNIQIADIARFERKPGLWDPIVGIGYHHVGEKFEAHGILEGGGFGVGSDSEFAAGFRADWKPARHFGLTAGYSYLRFKFKHDVASKTLEATRHCRAPLWASGCTSEAESGNCPTWMRYGDHTGQPLSGSGRFAQNRLEIEHDI